MTTEKSVSIYSNGNYYVEVVKRFDGLYTVNYYINKKIINKTTHNNFNVAESLAKDFICEGNNLPELLLE